MIVIHDLHELHRPLKDVVLTIGNFDGVHLGHREIFRQILSRSRGCSGTSAVMTFVPHPLKLLAPEKLQPLINTYDEKERLIEASRIDVLFSLPFDAHFSKISAEAFVRDILVEKIGVRHLLVGYDYAFGRHREGDVEVLTTYSERYGFTLGVLDPVQEGERLFSSTRVRELILSGEVKEAVHWLGRHFSLEGTVVRGDGRGRGLGFTTANLATAKELLPKQGVYAVKVRLGDVYFDGVANLGKNPTFPGASGGVEVHLLDFDKDIYGKPLRIYFMERLRGEKTFSGPDELKNAILDDISVARNILSTERLVIYREYLSENPGSV